MGIIDSRVWMCSKTDGFHPGISAGSIARKYHALAWRYCIIATTWEGCGQLGKLPLALGGNYWQFCVNICQGNDSVTLSKSYLVHTGAGKYLSYWFPMFSQWIFFLYGKLALFFYIYILLPTLTFYCSLYDINIDHKCPSWRCYFWWIWQSIIRILLRLPHWRGEPVNIRR